MEVIQYIVYIAYDNEVSSKAQPTTGARSLLFDSKKQTSNWVFASTTLDTEYVSRKGRESMHKFLGLTSPARLEVTVHTYMPGDYMPDILCYASRWKTLRIDDYMTGSSIVRQLDICKAALSHTSNLVIDDRMGRVDSNRLILDEKLLKNLQHPSAPNLRSSAVSIRFLVGLVPSGLLANVIDLRVKVDQYASFPSFEEYITSISQLKKLISLKLYCYGSQAFTSIFRVFYGADNYHRRMTSLKWLQVNGFFGGVRRAYDTVVFFL